jgi:hypothetical protein
VQPIEKRRVKECTEEEAKSQHGENRNAVCQQVPSSLNRERGRQGTGQKGEGKCRALNNEKGNKGLHCAGK